MQMNTRPTVSDILDSASQLEAEDFDRLFKKMAILHAQRSGMATMPEEEAALILRINKGFSATRFERLHFLNWKSETASLSEKEEAELLRLATAFENYTVRRLQLLVKLADLRKVSLDDLLVQLELKPLDHA
jgi:hypothetical protein